MVTPPSFVVPLGIDVSNLVRPNLCEVDDEYWAAAQELHGRDDCKTVLTGNAVAELLGTVLLPLARFLLLTPVGEQPSSSLIFQWPSTCARSGRGNVLVDVGS